MLLVCTRINSYVTRTLLVCYSYVIRTLLVRYSYVTRTLLVIRTLLVCYSYVLECYLYVLLCTRVVLSHDSLKTSWECPYICQTGLGCSKPDCANRLARIFISVSVKFFGWVLSHYWKQKKWKPVSYKKNCYFGQLFILGMWKRTPRDCINKLIIWILNPLVPFKNAIMNWLLENWTH